MSELRSDMSAVLEESSLFTTYRTTSSTMFPGPNQLGTRAPMRARRHGRLTKHNSQSRSRPRETRDKPADAVAHVGCGGARNGARSAEGRTSCDGITLSRNQCGTSRKTWPWISSERSVEVRMQGGKSSTTRIGSAVSAAFELQGKHAKPPPPFFDRLTVFYPRWPNALATIMAIREIPQRARAFRSRSVI